jgi:ADP-ribosylation factor GTPase-activating protein 1
MCLTCSGVHRGLGVHISFVRSITMDAFKNTELARMKSGGNKPWRDFYNAHETVKSGESKKWEDASINERYDSEAGDEWKERLSAKVEGREVDLSKVVKQADRQKSAMKSPGTGGGLGSQTGSRSNTPLSRTRTNDSGPRSSTPSSMTGGSGPSLGTSSLNPQASRKAQNEAYFSRMGAENATRPDDVPPNQGGKYGGFGSSPWPEDERKGGSPGLDEFQKDPVAALSKGFGWLSATVGKGAQMGIAGAQAGMKTVSENDFVSHKSLYEQGESTRHRG